MDVDKPGENALPGDGVTGGEAADSHGREHRAERAALSRDLYADATTAACNTLARRRKLPTTARSGQR